MASIVVCGYMVRHPVAGNMLAYFSYLLGLRRLGHDVCYLEESGWPYSCYDPARATYTDGPAEGLRRLRTLLAAHGLDDIPVYYVNRDSGTVTGGDRENLNRILRSADLLLNIGGVCWLPEFQECSRLALVDMDPFFTQVGRFAAEGMGYYHSYFSYGANIGQPGCTVPTGGIDWVPTVPPVVPEMWERGLPPAGAPFTTVANWSAYGTLMHEGERYGQKDVEFLGMAELPAHSPRRLEVALSGAPTEVVERLVSSGWLVRDAAAISEDMAAYRSYIGRSYGEFSVAKHAYVKTRSGWFSDRSVCYLASGLPVVLHDTGYSDWLPTGRGVLAFSTLEEAARCIESVTGDYEVHRMAALEIAEGVFSYRRVLPRLVNIALGGSPSPLALHSPRGAA